MKPFPPARQTQSTASSWSSNFTGKATAEKVALLRENREAEYEKLKDAVYQRRGWTPDGIPTQATVKRLGIDFPDVVLDGEGFMPGEEWYEFPKDTNHPPLPAEYYQNALSVRAPKPLYPEELLDLTQIPKSE